MLKTQKLINDQMYVDIEITAQSTFKFEWTIDLNYSLKI